MRQTNLQRTRDILGPGTTGGPITHIPRETTAAEQRSELARAYNVNVARRRGAILADTYETEYDPDGLDFSTGTDCD